jgi:hypothetical protein
MKINQNKYNKVLENRALTLKNNNQSCDNIKKRHKKNQEIW